MTMQENGLAGLAISLAIALPTVWAWGLWLLYSERAKSKKLEGMLGKKVEEVGEAYKLLDAAVFGFDTIAALETPKASATVKKMASMAGKNAETLVKGLTEMDRKFRA